MRLHILSDLHQEFGEVSLPPTNADVIILAGDIHLGAEGCRWARKRFPDRPVIYVLGNHEFYRHALPELTGLLQAEDDGSNLCVLENNSVEIGGITFLGCTLWTDFQILGNSVSAMQIAEKYMSDYHMIRFSPEHRPLKPQDTARLHAESVAWLKKQLSKSDPARTVVVTHHSPTAQTEAPYHTDSALKPAFSSNLDSLIEQSGVPLWIHGHTHYNGHAVIGSTRVLTNQRGYPDDLCQGFDPALIVEV